MATLSFATPNQASHLPCLSDGELGIAWPGASTPCTLWFTCCCMFTQAVILLICCQYMDPVLVVPLTEGRKSGFLFANCHKVFTLSGLRQVRMNDRFLHQPCAPVVLQV